MGAGAVAVWGGAHAGAGGPPLDWFGSPFTGRTYVVERDPVAFTKTLVAPDGRRFGSVADVVESEMRAMTPLERLFPAELLGLAGDSSRGDEMVMVTCLYRDQPMHDAGARARERADPILMAALAREHAVLDRIAPLRTFPGGQVPDVATAMREEAALLTDDEKKTLREAKQEIYDVLAKMRREAQDEATPEVERLQAPFREYVRSLPGAKDLGATVTLNAVSARVPARALLEIADRFPEIMRIDPVQVAVGCLDTAVSGVGAGSWWSASYNGSSSTKIGLMDSGVDTSHPALSGVVTASALWHTSAVSATTYGESTTSPTTDDLQGHGTNTAGIMCSGDSTYRGIAYGAVILNAKGAYLDTALGQARSYTTDSRQALDWAVNSQQGATVILITFGGAPAGAGTDEGALFFDAAAQAQSVSGVIAAKSAASAPPTAGTSGYPGGAFNALTCGCIDDNGTATRSDDFIWNLSGIGPTSDNRQKPDIAGPGVSITTTAHDWESTGNYFASISPGTSTGTSTVGPLVVGAIALLQDYGVAAYPPGFKALLISTAFGSTLQSSGSSSTYAAPNNYIGYGCLDCAGAYTYRNSVYEGSLTSSGPRFVLLRGGALASGKRASLVWMRHVTYTGGTTIPTPYYPIQDLDLFVYDEATGGLVASSANTVDPQEQVAVTSAVSVPIYKVWLASSSFTSNYSTEQFAVAAEATSSTQLVTPPTLACTYTTFSNAVKGNTDTTVTVTVTNSGGCAATAPVVTLTLPTGYTLTSGANPQTIAAVAGSGGTRTATWTVHSHNGPSGSNTFSVAAASTSYNEPFASSAATRNQTVDVDAPTGSIVLADDAAYTTTTNLTATISATDALSGVSQMRVRNAGDAWGAWVAYATSAAIQVPSGDGTKTVEAQFQDAVGNLSAVYSDSIVYDLTAPTPGAFAIAAGAPYGNSASVTLTNAATDSASGVAQARYSNDGSQWSAWGLYQAEPAWNLVPGQGTRTVYAQYQDGAGNVSSVVNDTIVVETVAPVGSVVVANGDLWTNNRSVTLTLLATDATSGVRDMRFSDDGFIWTSWRTYATTTLFNMSAGEGQRTVYAQFRDNALNLSNTASDGIGVDTTGPNGSVIVSNDTSFATNPSVTLASSATDAMNGVAQMRFSNDFATWSAWQAYATTSVNWTLSPGDGLKFVYVQFMDGVGNISAATWDTITVDTAPPEAELLIEAGAAAIASPNVSLNVTGTDAGSGVVSARMSNDGATWDVWVPAQESLPWTMTAGEGVKTVYVQVRDGAGNVSTAASDTIVLDLTPPTGSFVVTHDAPYVMPWDELVAETTSSDGPAGSGVAAFRTSTDAGATWSDWAILPPNGRVPVARPAAGKDKALAVLGEFKDVAGNVSARASDASFLVDAGAASVTTVNAFTGVVGPAGDVDVVRIQLVAHDKLTLKLKTKTLVKKADARVDIDVWGPARTQLVTGRHPSTSKTAGVSKFEATATGEYWIVLRAAGTKADTGVSYTLTPSVTAGKGNRSRKGTLPLDAGAPRATLSFDAVEGMKVAATLTVSDRTQLPTLKAPDGSDVALVVAPGTKGPLKVSVPKLVGAAGTYVMTVPSTAQVKFTLTLTPGKPAKLAE